MTAPVHANGASTNGLATTPVEALALPDGNCLAIERVPAADHDCHQARVGVFLDETHRYISTRAAHSLSLSLAWRESCALEGVAVWRRAARNAHEDPSGVWLVIRRGDGQEVGVRLLGSHADAVAKMFSRAEVPTAEEAAESRRREQADRLANEERQREAEERRQAEARMLAERMLRRRETWRAVYGDLPMPDGDDDDDGPGLDTEDGVDETPRIVVPRFGIAAGGRPILVCGLPGSQKSWLLHDLGLAIARGEGAAWGGIPIEIEGEFLFLEYENPPATTRARVDRLCRARGLRGRDDVDAYRLVKPTTLLIDSDAKERLTRECWGVRACGIDSLQTACGEQKEKFDRVLAMLPHVTMRTGTTFFVIVHCVKHPGRVKDLLARLEFISGRNCDSALWVERKSGNDTVRIDVSKASNVPEDSVQPALVRLVGGVDEPVRFEPTSDGQAKVSMRVTPEDKIRRRVLSALTKQSLSYRGLREEVTGKNETIQRVLVDLVAAGEVVLDPETRLYKLAGGRSPVVASRPTATPKTPRNKRSPRTAVGGPLDGTRGPPAVPTIDRKSRGPQRSPAVPGTTGPLAPAPRKGAGQGQREPSDDSNGTPKTGRLS
ncbi:MAG: AAA family ATPase [Polyangiaceae bacterium]